MVTDTLPVVKKNPVTVGTTDTCTSQQEYSLKETGYSDTVVIADKWFYSESNLDFLEKEGLDYIVPLKRNSKLVDYERYESHTRSGNHFLFEGRMSYFAVSISPKGNCSNLLHNIVKHLSSDNPNPDDEWVDSYDVCTFLKISKRTLQRFRVSGLLPHKRISQKTY